MGSVHMAIKKRFGRAEPGSPGVPSDPGPFRPAWWLPGGHLQTLWPVFFRRRRLPALHRERLELPDGDFLDLDWVSGAPEGAPVVVLLHGLEGGGDSHYLPGLATGLRKLGMEAVLMYLRGCSGEPNRTARRYTGGSSDDLGRVVEHVQAVRSGSPLAAVGYSLGGNILLKGLGEMGECSPLTCAVAVSPPFQLDQAAARLERGLSRIYRRHLLGSLKRAMMEKYRQRSEALPVSVGTLDRLRTFRAFDDAVTAPLHGYDGVADYYTRASCRPYLKAIQSPTLILHSTDDPFTTPEAVPTPQELSPQMTLELYPRGGHVAFLAGACPGRPRYWLDQRILTYLQGAFGVPREAPAAQG